MPSFTISFSSKTNAKEIENFFKNVLSQVKLLISCHLGNQVSIYHLWTFSSLHIHTNSHKLEVDQNIFG